MSSHSVAELLTKHVDEVGSCLAFAVWLSGSLDSRSMEHTVHRPPRDGRAAGPGAEGQGWQRPLLKIMGYDLMPQDLHLVRMQGNTPGAATVAGQGLNGMLLVLRAALSCGSHSSLRVKGSSRGSWGASGAAVLA